ncbi:hypothetical protein [Skermania sp. ID1734]|uniref:LGFP repeat-containing protein n=1 Tax=Skermania sp. ID1734 TaxID=2597516 RepID=UPI001C8F6A60
MTRLCRGARIELSNPDGIGKQTSFDHDASIYWAPSPGAHEMGGAIGAKWCRLGCERVLGYPTADELTNPRCRCRRSRR